MAADLIKRLDSASLRVEDLETLSRGRPVLPTRWYDYVWDSHWEQGLGDLWTSLPPIIPLAIVDSRIADLALGFLEHPDEKLMTGYRRLEDIIRKRTGIDEHGARLFSEAFQGKERKLAWKGLAPSESDGRALLFRAVYMAFRNPRAHRELDNPDQAHISEFMLLNQLFLLERQATLTGS